jgi:hypothetical protein
MKKIFIILIVSVSICACKKNTQDNGDWFQIEIAVQKDNDCGLPDIIFLSRQTEAYQVIGDNRGMYVALGLPKVNYPVGTKMYVSIRQPSANEIVACTAMGPLWTQVFIKEVK